VNTITHGDNLLIGALLAQLVNSFPTVIERIARKAGFFVEGVLFLGLPVYYAILSSHVLSPATVTVTYFISAILTTTLVMVLGFGGGPISRMLAKKPLVFLGGLTYAGYMFHEFAVGISWVVVRRVIHDAYAASLVRWVVAIPLTFVLAYIVRVTFEARILKFKKRFSPAIDSSAVQVKTATATSA
jgi:peptidoglycan/LPS O-acetylase OafA/YrhL